MSFSRNYYLAANHDCLLYATLSLVEQGYEVSLYRGKELLDRRSVRKGFVVLDSQGYLLKVNFMALKTTVELTYEGTPVELDKVKSKKLRLKLIEHGIENELTKKSTERVVRLKDFRLPALIILVVSTGLVFVDHRLLQIVFILGGLVGFYMLYDRLFNLLPKGLWEIFRPFLQLLIAGLTIVFYSDFIIELFH